MDYKLVFCRWTLATFYVLEKNTKTGFTKIQCARTRDITEVSPDAFNWNYIKQIPQNLLLEA